MEQQKLSNLLKFIVIGVGICSLIVYGFLIPSFASSMKSYYPDLSHYYYPWLIFVWSTAIPFYIILVCLWKIALHMEHNHSFSKENSKLLAWISNLSLGDALFFFIGNVVFLFFNMNHPGIVIVSFFIMFIGIAISVASAILSHLVRKAATLQEENDLTI